MEKEEILAAIRQTAKDNGGKPLGRERFERVTGIKMYDLNRYWARYSDAQIEAGFNPNTLNIAYDDHYLLGKLADLTLELNKQPTKTEMRLKSFNDPDFPAANTFDRLGSKHVRTLKLLKFCGDKQEYASVATIIGDISEEQYNLEAASSKELKYGFVYLVKGHPGEYKIGRTNLVDRRLSELGATASIEQTLVHEIKTDDPAGIESYWHRRFQDKRMKGEWFKLGPSEVQSFKRWKRIS